MRRSCTAASYAYTPRDFDVALALLENDAVPYRSWITERDLADGEDAFRALVEHPDEVTEDRPATGALARLSRRDSGDCLK